MPLPYLSENDFKDPIIFQKRDIAIPATDTNKKIVDNIIVLDEIPEYINHITIDGYHEVFDANTVLQANQFRTNYTLGILTFSPSQEGRTISQIKYNATGVIYTPASRIYTQLSEDGKTVEQTLQEMIDSINVYQYMGSYDDSIPYTSNQQVYYNGSTYIAIKNTTGNPPTAQEYWRLLGAGFISKGDYDSNSPYYPRDVVFYDVEKSLYICKESTNPGVLPTDTGHWDKLVSFKSIYDTESARVAAENVRAAAESVRIAAEADRTYAEIMRADNETERVNAETGRSDTEADRINAESLRVSAENSRVTAETSRVSVEAGRVEAENTRNSNEANRQNGETARTSQENARVSAETGRVTAENNRASAESTRVSDEDIRSNNETSRQANETARQNHDSAIQVWEPYDNSKAYVPLNKVEYLGSSYICTSATTGNLPTNTAYWTLIAQRGTDGSGSGTVLSVTSANSDINVTNPDNNPVLTLNSGIEAEQIVKRNSDAQIPFTDISGYYPNMTVEQSLKDIGDKIDILNGDIQEQQNEIGTSSQLQTTDKSSLVNAINEVNAHANTSLNQIDNLSQNLESASSSLTVLQTTVDAHVTDTMYYSTGKLNVDSNGIYTEVQHKRADGTLVLKSILSGGTSPRYTTRVETKYATDGATVEWTKTYTITYDNNGNVASEVMQ